MRYVGAKFILIFFKMCIVAEGSIGLSQYIKMYMLLSGALEKARLHWKKVNHNLSFLYQSTRHIYPCTNTPVLFVNPTVVQALTENEAYN